MESTLHVPTPKTPTHRDLGGDDKLHIQTLYYTAGWSIDETRLQFPKITPRQIQYALETRPTPQRKGHCGAHALLNTPWRKELVQWVTSRSLTREVPWAEIPKWLKWKGWCGEKAIRTALKEGYCRAIRRKKPSLTEENQRKRLQWAYDHENWTLDMWDTICWSDESWV